MAQKDIRAVIRKARAAGWTVERTGRGHLRIAAPDGRAAVVAPGSTSDHRAHLNLRAQLRRAGAQI